MPTAENSSPSTPPADAAPSTAVKPLPPPRQPSAPQPAGARHRILDGLIVAAVLLFAFLSALFPVHNSDFFLHAATGRLIAHGQYQIGVDPFAYTTQGAYWVNLNWLYDLIVYLLYDSSVIGGTTLIVLKALMIAALAEVMLRAAREPGRSLWIPACCVGLAVLALTPRVQLAPACVSYFFLGLTYWLLLLPRRNRIRAAEAGTAPPRQPFLPYWLVPPLCLLWVNLDGWFLLGPAVVALYLVGETVQDAWSGRRGFWAPGERRTLLIVLIASVAACLVNPHHVWAFRPPAQLGLSEGAAVLAGDDQFRWLFYSPFESTYFYPQIGLSVAGMAFFPLALLGAASFAATQWVGRWHWGRALLWLAFLALAAWLAGAIPFFAVVAGPITSLNFLDFAAARRDAKAPAGAWPVGGRILTLAGAVALLVAAWPGWLQSAPQEGRRVGWTVEPDPALRQAAQQIAAWRKEGLVGLDDRWFNTAPAVLPYLAWYAPGERGAVDQVRLDLYDASARDYAGVRKSLAVKDGDAGQPDPTWRKLLRRQNAHFLIWYEANSIPMRPSSPLRTLLSNPDEWPLLYLGGPTAVFGWHDPAKEGDDQLSHLKSRTNADRTAFGSDAVAAPPAPPHPAPREWWAALWTPEPPRPPAADEAAVRLERFADLIPVWRQRNEAKWAGLWEERKRFILAAGATACFGSAGPWSGPAEVEAVRGVLASMPEKAVMPSSPPQPGEEFQYSQARQLFDFGPSAELYLSIRAARRALAVKADDPRTYESLADAYYTMLQQTRELPRGAALAYPRGDPDKPYGDPLPVALRHVQMTTALHRALELDPNDQIAEGLSAEVYGQMGFLDLAKTHAENCLRIAQESGASAQAVKPLSDEVKKLADDVQHRDDTYTVRTANKPVLEKVQAALDAGLVQKALDELLQVDWTKDKDPNNLLGMQRELSLMVQTGRGEEVLPVLIEQEKSLRADLGVDADVGLPAYEWLRVEIAAARGDYADADHWLDEIGRKMRMTAPLLPVLMEMGVVGQDGAGLHDPDTESLTGLLLGDLLLRNAPTAVRGGWLPLFPPGDAPLLLYMYNGAITEPLSRQSDVDAMRGWLALEAGEVAAARGHFQAALQRAPPDQVLFRGRALTDLGMELLDAGAKDAK